MKILQFFVTLAFLTVTPYAFSGQWNFDNWEDCCYADVGGGYEQSGSKFRGGGGYVDVGYNFYTASYGQHNIELQFKFLFEDGKKRTAYLNTSVPVYNSSGVITGYETGSAYLQAKVAFNQYPFLLNYRFRTTFGSSWFGMYLGAGVGVNIINDVFLFNENYYDLSGNPLGNPSVKKSNAEAQMIGQIFAGLSCKLADEFNFNLGGTLMGTHDYYYGGSQIPNTSIYTPTLNTEWLHWMVDASLTWTF